MQDVPHMLSRRHGRGADSAFGVALGVAAAILVVIAAEPAAAQETVMVTPAVDTIPVGGSVTLQAVVTDARGRERNRRIRWASADPAIATVSDAGTVLGVAAGRATIEATSFPGNGRGSATIVVTGVAQEPVEEPAPEPEPEPVVTEPAPEPVAGAGPVVAECASPKSGWIWCDDFEQDRLGQYFEYESANGSFSRVGGVGASGSTGMRARFDRGQVEAGNLKVAFGRTPSSTFRPVDGGAVNYPELYWRIYVRTQAGWTGGSGEKLSRAMILAGTNWQQAMIAHVWGADAPDNQYLAVDPASGTTEGGELRTRQYNDFQNLRWLGAVRTRTPWFDAAHVGQWLCVEAHVRLNGADQANGVFELWVNGQLEAQKTGLNWVGSYEAYGLNAVFVENYWNSGSPQAQERYFDNFVVSTQPIGC